MVVAMWCQTFTSVSSACACKAQSLVMSRSTLALRCKSMRAQDSVCRNAAGSPQNMLSPTAAKAVHLHPRVGSCSKHPPAMIPAIVPTTHNALKTDNAIARAAGCHISTMHRGTIVMGPAPKTPRKNLNASRVCKSCARPTGTLNRTKMAKATMRGRLRP